MYKGNMQEFMDRLIPFVEKNHGIKLIFVRDKETAYKDGKYVHTGRYIPCITVQIKGWITRYHQVKDDSDFEQQVYDVVNKSIDRIKGER